MPDGMWWIVALVVVAALLTGAAWLSTALRARAAGARYGALTAGSRDRPPRDRFRAAAAAVPVPAKVAHFVVNPTKIPDPADLLSRLAGACARHGFAPPVLHETTADDPGLGQGRAAVAQGADVVVGIGGDGTVRALATALAGSSCPLALVPLGTTNLLARNLDLPLQSLDALLDVALTGRNRRIDVGVLTVVGPDRPGPDGPGSDGPGQVEHLFTVMAGVGMDGEVMADTSENLKAHIGWPAYVVSGAGKMLRRGFKASVSIDHEMPFTRRVRSVLVGNCGRLTGGLVLMPEAKIDDGRLDAAIIAPLGLVGWSGVVLQSATRHRFGHARTQILPATTIRIELDRPTHAQVDGDHLGLVRAATMTVRPRALSVRVGPPAGRASSETTSEATGGGTS